MDNFRSDQFLSVLSNLRDQFLPGCMGIKIMTSVFMAIFLHDDCHLWLLCLMSVVALVKVLTSVAQQ